MLTNLNDILRPALKDGRAVAQFNAITATMARAVIEAAEAANQPVVLGIEEKQLSLLDMEDFISFALPIARRAAVPVAVHLDHCSRREVVLAALKAGFTSVNYDCSKAGFEENVSQVAEISAIAHSCGATVEAELGHVPLAADLQGDLDDADMTLPNEARDFVWRTGVDALGISVGTAMGTYQTQPKLDYDRIRAISETARIPLTLHGGSGLSDKALRQAVEAGITKVNFFTDIDIAAAQGIIFAVNSGVSTMSEILPYEYYAIRVQAAEKLRLMDKEQ